MSRHSPALHAAPRAEQLRASLATVRALLDERGASLLRDPQLASRLGALPNSPFSSAEQGLQGVQEQLRAALEHLPDLEHGLSRRPLPLTVGIVDGTSLAHVFAGVAEMLVLPTNEAPSARMREILRRTDLVLISPEVAHNESLIRQLSRQARRSSVPLVLVDLHQQVPDEASLQLADHCDHVAVVSEEGAESYGRAHGSHGVRSGQFVTLIRYPVTPTQHSPLGSRACSLPWVNFTVPEPTPESTSSQTAEHLQWILDGALASGVQLTITSGSRQLQELPVRYLPYTFHTEVEAGDLDRITDVSVVLDPVPASQSLISPRTLHSQASGSMVLSTYNQGANSYSPQVHIANSARDVRDSLLTIDELELYRAQEDGVRQVFAYHHATDVLTTIARAAGLDVSVPTERPVAVLVGEASAQAREALEQELAVQTCGPVKLIEWEQLIASSMNFDILLPVSADRSYSPEYVQSHLTSFRIQQAAISVVPESPSLAFSHELGEVAFNNHSSFYCSAWWRPAPDSLISTEVLAASSSGRRVFYMGSTLPSPRAKQSDQQLMTPSLRAVEGSFKGDDIDVVSGRCHVVAERENLLLSVVVPIYNNGAHLRHKAFASLRRSSIFDKMHILLVSDGSTDPLTLATIEELSQAHSNVTAYHHSPGGSGSASRPRNTGLELVRTPYVTYLDPDNEAVEDGYALLFEEIQADSSLDFVIGNMSIWTRGFSMQHYGALLNETFSDCMDSQGNIHVPERALEKLAFRPMGIQTLVARTPWLQSLGITQPLGAVGQDSYFFQQMLHYARKIRALDIPIHTYYAAVSDSTVNTINPRYFKKYLPLDRDRARWLEEVGLMDAYKRQRLEKFLVTWHLPKLRKVKEDQWLEAAENIAELLACYGPTEWQDVRTLDFMDRLESARNRA